MAKLNAAARRSLPSKDFVFPGKRGFPINDASHARAALRERKFASNPGKVVADVKRKFPSIGKSLLSRGMKKK